MAGAYAMTMTMIRFLVPLVAGIAGLGAAVSPDALARGGGPRHDQDTARREMLDGRVMPFSVIRRRTEQEMGEATYIGVRPPRNGVYRMQYLQPDGRVVWVDVDGKTGEILGRTR